MPKESAAIAAIAQPAESWPRAGFWEQASRRLAELDASARTENEIANRIEGFQSRAELHGLTLATSIGKDEAAKLGAEQAAAQRRTLEKRNELRQSLEAERGAFYTRRNAAWARHYPETTARFSRAKQYVPDLLDGLHGLLGMKSEIERQEREISEWNREARRFNRLIPAQNVHGIPRASGIDLGESSRASIEAMFMQDPVLWELCRGIITAEGDKRIAAQLREFNIQEQADRQANPASFEPPF